jgi:polyhydroxyalkanoate synthesis repressor PhaR
MANLCNCKKTFDGSLCPVKIAENTAKPVKKPYRIAKKSRVGVDRSIRQTTIEAMRRFCGDTKLVSDNGSDTPMRVQLRRYPNRRYYDAARSQHLTLDEIFRLICEGHSVEVNDSKSGEDITTRVLAQLILEQAPGKWAALPAELFHQLIRANESLLREFVEKYFHRALQAFEKSQREFEQYMRQALGLSNELLAMSPAPWGANWAGMMLNPFMRGFLAADGAPRTSAEEQPSDGTNSNRGTNSELRTDSDLRTELEELKHEVVELRKELRQR